ncbi:MAG: 1,4-dihydroxy-2-naphthoate polyprenyltransferase [Balneolaceae bacterium]
MPSSTVAPVRPNRRTVWIKAARLHTLPAAIVPVVIGSTLAWTHGAFHAMPSAVALFCALLIQIGTNFANDYFDHQKGADRDDRIGFTRATASGWVAPRTMWRATLLTMGIAFLAGLWLVWHAGWVILILGLLSLLFGILYTGGPFPLGYNGLGDLFVFLFFGLVAVNGTYYVNTLAWSIHAVWLSIPVGTLCVNILVVNNLRDIEQDRWTGKRTLGVLLGENALKVEYALMLLAAWLVLPHLWVAYDYSAWIFLPWAATPLAGRLLTIVWCHETKEVLNQTLTRTGMLMVLYGLLLSIALLLQP